MLWSIVATFVGSSIQVWTDVSFSFSSSFGSIGLERSSFGGGFRYGAGRGSFLGQRFPIVGFFFAF